MNINIPPDSEAWLFSARGPDQDGGLWSFRWPPPCEPGDVLVFRFGGRPVARAVVHQVFPPGELDNWAHHGKRYLSGHKVAWLWKTFEDLREQPATVEQILAAEKVKRRRLRD